MCGILDRKSLALRGIVAVIFGILAIVATQFVLDFLVYMFGFFAIINGILNAVSGSPRKRVNFQSGFSLRPEYWAF